MTHDELVRRAGKWLEPKSVVVVTEMVSGAQETPDAIGFSGYRSTLIECKTSMADFRADAKKSARRREPRPGDGPNARGWLGTHLGDKRYYLVPEAMAEPVLALLDREDSPWGLLVAPEDQRRRLVRRREARDGFEGNSHQSEIALLLSAMCRIAARRNLENAVYVRAYVVHKQQGGPKATMAIRPTGTPSTVGQREADEDREGGVHDGAERQQQRRWDALSEPPGEEGT